MNTNSINKFIEKSTGLKKSQKVVDYTRDSGAGNIAYRLNRVDRWRQGDFHVVKYYQNTYDFYFDNVDARYKSTDVINALKSLGCMNIIDHSDRGFIKFDIPKENVMNSRVIKSSQAHLHSDNMEDVRERLENTITQSSVDTMYDGEDCFITVTQKNYETMNESKWSFCVDFGTGKVQMLEPTEDEESFSNDNEVFGIIKNFLNGGMSREKRRNRPDYDRGEPIKITGKGNKIGSARKPIKSANENQKYDYYFFRDKLKGSPYFEEYVVRFDDDAGEDNIHTKTDIPVTITYPDGKVKDYSNCYVQFYGSGWRFIINRGWSGKEKYSDIENVSITPNSITIEDKEGWVIDFLIGNGINSSR